MLLRSEGGKWDSKVCVGCVQWGDWVGEQKGAVGCCVDRKRAIVCWCGEIQGTGNMVIRTLVLRLMKCT